MENQTQTPPGMEIRDEYTRGKSINKAFLSTATNEEAENAFVQLAGSVLVPEKDWEAIKRVNLELRQRLERAEVVLNSLAYYLRDNFAGPIARGEHEGMEMDQIIKRYLAQVVKAGGAR